MNTPKSAVAIKANRSIKLKTKTSTEPKIRSANLIQSSQLMKLFEDEIKDIYWAEKALTKAIPKMIKYSSSNDLITALKKHLEETKAQTKRIEQVFEILDKKATAKKCEAMQGLIDEAGEIMASCEEGAMRDAGIISAGQKIEHYEIATYGTLRQFAEALGLDDAEALLKTTLEEEKAADVKLTEIAVAAINLEASEEKSKALAKRS